jgi:hypothetical protein
MWEGRGREEKCENIYIAYGIWEVLWVLEFSSRARGADTWEFVELSGRNSKKICSTDWVWSAGLL